MLSLSLLLPCTAAARPGEFEAKIYQGEHGRSMPYRLFVPASDGSSQMYPLVLWLHGGGGRGADNQRQISEGNSVGATIWTRQDIQKRFPAFVLAPQCPAGEMWTTIGPAVRPTARLLDVVALVKSLQRTFRIDPSRIYVVGQSMGGFGAWSLITTYPRMFAAAVPICGGGDEAFASAAATIPIWAFHGELDEAVRVERSRRMVAAVRRAGGRPKFTEYKGAGHTVWTLAFAEPKLLPWVFAQRRSGS